MNENQSAIRTILKFAILTDETASKSRFRHHLSISFIQIGMQFLLNSRLGMQIDFQLLFHACKPVCVHGLIKQKIKISVTS